MRLLKRNLVPVWALEVIGHIPVVNENGKKTGEHRIVYSEPVMYMMNVSAARGTAKTEQFGADVQYEKVMMTDDMKCPITETSVLFIDKDPVYNDKGMPVFEYIVKQVARSLNSISYAISKVKVS